MDGGWGVAGADTHKDSITFAVIASTVADVALRSFDVTPAGVAEIIEWLSSSDVKIIRVGIEGSAGWGLPVSKALVAAGFDVREVNDRTPIAGSTCCGSPKSSMLDRRTTT